MRVESPPLSLSLSVSRSLLAATQFLSQLVCGQIDTQMHHSRVLLSSRVFSPAGRGSAIAASSSRGPAAPAASFLHERRTVNAYRASRPFPPPFLSLSLSRSLYLSFSAFLSLTPLTCVCFEYCLLFALARVTIGHALGGIVDATTRTKRASEIPITILSTPRPPPPG